MKSQNQDRLDYSQTLFLHMNELSRLGSHIFDEEQQSEGSKLATQSSRLASYYAQICQLQSFMHSNLDNEYYSKVGPMHKFIQENLYKSYGMPLFLEMQKILDELMVIMQNKGFLFRERSEEESEEEVEDVIA